MNALDRTAGEYTDEERRELIAYEHVFGIGDATHYREGLADMARGYFAALLWTQPDYDDEENEDGDRTLDQDYGVSDVHPADVADMVEEFRALVVAHPLALALYRERSAHRVDASEGTVWDYFGHDYLLTRDHHGAGFWDRGLGDLGEYLTGIVHAAGEHDTLTEEFGQLTSTPGRG
ncbi:hypothetical protein KNU02_gp95 [Gordonia phage Pleakley]|uniref:Uncharacterized protein n=1 Tax=Gordonia phage Pleakley TaxID=2283246 RepID=A0A345M6L3_9CAUD|nr:hypothetical protein KNU02_gp95 [Gordonia phage Pleakley]AXH49820.1 hypothetical protein SEA_FURY_95 [Gordonia phage Fury]AXH66134.1 hypothetical protein SEA_PLEAKLEY_95 [Gordonia phage Pleakley]